MVGRLGLAKHSVVDALDSRPKREQRFHAEKRENDVAPGRVLVLTTGQ